MKLVVVGVNHKTAPVAMREQLAFGDDLSQALSELATLTEGATIVSTCNRSEIYAYLPEEEQTFNEIDEHGELIINKHNIISEWLSNFKGIDGAVLTPYLYVYEGNRALTHWLRVAVGLDSMILGEPQILGQIKQAVSYAHQFGSMTATFDWLTQRLFGAARIVRRDTALGRQAVTLGFATAKLVTQIFQDPKKTTLMVVATGEMNRLVAHNVASLGVEKVILCNRNRERAERLGEELSAMASDAGRTLEIELCAFDALGEKLPEADVISSCSGSMALLIDKEMVKQAMKVRRHRAMLMVDLAVPRDIAPEVGNIDGVYLYSIDDLEHVIAGNIEERKQAAVEAELLVGQLVSEIEVDVQVQAMGKVISDYQNTAQQKKSALLTKALKQLEQGKDPRQVLENFAHHLTQTLAHPPTKLLRISATQLDEAVVTQVKEGLLGAYRKP